MDTTPCFPSRLADARVAFVAISIWLGLVVGFALPQAPPLPDDAKSVLGQIEPAGFVSLSRGPGPWQQPQNPQPALDAEKVRKAIRLGINYLKSAQQNDGSWRDVGDYKGGTTALVTLALINAGEPVNSPTIRNALRSLEGTQRFKTYVVSLRVMALVAADPKGRRYRNLIQRDVDWLIETQTQSGGWSYDGGLRGMGGDASNSQFGLLALKEASTIGIKVPKRTWTAAREYWTSLRHPSGGFGYNPTGGRRIGFDQSRGSMTCAGIASMIIIDEQLFNIEDHSQGGLARCCQGDDSGKIIDQAIQWLASNYSVRVNPREGRMPKASQLYYLYALERAGRFSGRRFIGPNDWYRDGALELLKMQLGGGAWRGVSSIYSEQFSEIATSFALLFLSKGKRPVAIGKFDHGVPDWDQHPRGVHYLTRRLENEWNQKLNWQTVRAENSTADDLFEAPVLFLSGKQAIGLNREEKETLKKYIENGGFLFAEACQGEGCGDGKFEEAFVKLMEELFPDSELKPLESNHPIWNAHFPLLPNAERPLSGLQACCRTAVVFCPKNLSCYWALGRPGVLENNGVNPALRNRIEYTQQLGINVIAYATGRELREKGETPTLVENEAELLKDRALVLPKLNHAGGADDAPNAWRRIQETIRQGTGLEINTNKKLIEPTLEQLRDHPMVFMHGRNRFSFSEPQREAIRNYLKMGGFIFAESICASDAFTQSFRREMQTILGNGALGPIPSDHEIWNDPRYGPRLDNVKLRTKNEKGEFTETLIAPQMEGVVFKGRLAVIFSPYDISCAMENTSVSNCDGYVRSDAQQIASNILFYTLLSDADQE